MAQFVEQGTIDLDAGDVGGDIQATKAVSRRFVRDDGDGAFTVLDVYAFGTEEPDYDNDGPNVIDMVAQFWYTECTDPTNPGSSETSGDIEYLYPYDVSPVDLEQARNWAEGFIRTIRAIHL